MADPVPLRQKRCCPICRKPSQRQFHPFCSSRCSQVDLNRWLGGQYAMPTNEAPDEGELGNEPENS
jgi:endogenous inhibitor of DNA gyrase (YacG/DUF329 family)